MNSAFWAGKKVLVTGGTGFIGRNVVERLRAYGNISVSAPGRAEFDLTREDEVVAMFGQHRPDIVFHLAGLVGGILENKQRPAEFYFQNLRMDSLVLHHAAMEGVTRFVAAAAACGYPVDAAMPARETEIWNGLPQQESAPFSLAKRMLCMQSAAYWTQYRFPAVICVIGGIYGPWDNYRAGEAHVVPALITRFLKAAADGDGVEVWGTGRATRDFIYAADAVNGLLRAAEHYDRAEVVNISSGVETPIVEVVEHLRELTGLRIEVRWLSDKPEGQLRRCLDIAKARRDLGFECETDIRQGLAATLDWYRRNLGNPELRR